MSTRRKLKFAICAPSDESREAITNACIQNDAEYFQYNILGDDWYEKITEVEVDGILIQPPCNYEEHKQIIDERVFVISTKLKILTYPSLEEILVYENKRNMSYWCEIYQLPTAKTKIFTNLKDSLNYINSTSFPVVSKSNVGAGGTSVQIIKSKAKAISLAKSLFGRYHPEFALGHAPWGVKKGIRFPRLGRIQKHYMILQEFLPIKWEWRLIRIGDSYFGHQKLLGSDQKASGSLKVGWEQPPTHLLEMLKKFSDDSGFRTVALDIFETIDGNYSVNEIQPLIGAYAPSQMYINGVPGRYKYSNGSFLFEEGEFCKNKCWDLRVQDLVKLVVRKR
ncbi:hypothetical protein AB4450_12020 [Vibrio breoganii]